MSGFSFPPPPPPPPKASSSNSNNQSSHSEPPGRGRGRGRGRGGNDGRGRGRGGRGVQSSHQRNQQQHGNYRESFASATSGSNAPSGRSDSSYGRQHSYDNVFTSQSPTIVPHVLSAGAYINPAFHQQSPSASSALPTRSQYQGSYETDTGPTRTFAGHKRKLDALRGPQDRGKKPDVPAALPIPSFGSPISPSKPLTVPVKPTIPIKSDANIHKKRTLGLTPGSADPQYSASDSEEDDADEEALFAQLGTTLKFEHNGEVVTIASEADLAAWKKERAQNFPTRDRIAAKMDEKRQLGAERRRLLDEASAALLDVRLRGKPGRSKAQNGDREPTQPDRPETELEKTKRELAAQEARLARLRKSVSQSEGRLKAAQAESEERAKYGSNEDDQAAVLQDRKALQVSDPIHSGGSTHVKTVEVTSPEAMQSSRLTQDNGKENDGLGHGDVPQQPDDPDLLSDASEVSSVVSSDSDDEASDSDGPPEEVSSRAPARENGTKKLPCKYFAASGHCKFGDACNFAHVRLPGGITREVRPVLDRHSKHKQLDNLVTTDRKSLHDLLVEKEQNEENRLAVQVIKYLGKLDFFAEQDVQILNA